jgi:ABC-type nitrate/sulfonate/bicarbonate transport system substrate-binding protein
MNRSKSGAAALVAASALMLSSCGDTGGAASAGEPVRLATGVDPSFTAVFVAEEKGFFEDHGVDVEVQKLEGGPAMAQSVIAGQSDMATQSDATTATLMATDPDLRALADFQHSDTYIKVVWGPDVEQASDIKKLATLPGIMTLATVRYLESQDIDPDSVELVSGSPPDVPTMLQRGDVDGTVIYEPWAARSAEESGGQAVGTIGDFGVSYAQWLVTDSEWLADHEAEAAKVLAAIADANDFIRENPEEAQQVLEDSLKIPTEQSAEIMKDLVFETRDIDDAALANTKETAQFFVDTGVMKSMPDLDEQVLVGWMSEHADD